MNKHKIRIIAPSVFPNSAWNEAEVLGGFVWLWGQRERYAQTALDVVLATVIEIIRSKNFAFFIKDGKPIGYFNWSYFSPAQEKAYREGEISYIDAVRCSESAEAHATWILTFFVSESNAAANAQTIRHFGKKLIFPATKFTFRRDNKRNIPTTTESSFSGYLA